MKKYLSILLVSSIFVANQVFAAFTFEINQDALHGLSGGVSITGIFVQFDDSGSPSEQFTIGDEIAINSDGNQITVDPKDYLTSSDMGRFSDEHDFDRNIGFSLRKIRIGDKTYDLHDRDDPSLVILNNKAVPINLFYQFPDLSNQVILTVFNKAYPFQK